MQVKQEYGIHNECLIHISESESKKIYLCPCCNSELIAKKGKIKIHHFSHKNLDACGGALETSLHIMAKEILSQSNTILLPINFKHNNLFDYQIKTSDFGVELIYDSVVVEKKVDDIIPDLILYSNGFPLLVEIKVTHGIDEIKLEKIEQINIPLIEISIDYKKNDATTKESLEMILFKSTREKSVIRSPQDCFDRIVLMNEMDSFVSNVNLKNQTIILPTKKYLTFNQEPWMEEGYPPKCAFLIADNTQILISDFKFIGKNYGFGDIYIEMSFGPKKVLSIFSFKHKILKFHDWEHSNHSIINSKLQNLIKNDELITEVYNSIFVINCNNLNLIQIYELLKSNINSFNKYFIKNKQIDFLKLQVFNKIKTDVESKNIIKSFGKIGHLYGQQIRGSNCPQTKQRVNLRRCRECISLIKLDNYWTSSEIIACGEELNFKQVFVNEMERDLIDFHHELDFEI